MLYSSIKKELRPSKLVHEYFTLTLLCTRTCTSQCDLSIMQEEIRPPRTHLQLMSHHLSSRELNIDILLRNSMRYTILSYFKQNIKEEIVLSKNSCQFSCIIAVISYYCKNGKFVALKMVNFFTLTTQYMSNCRTQGSRAILGHKSCACTYSKYI